jgi:DNA-binding GntR family transcriptional regulator
VKDHGHAHDDHVKFKEAIIARDAQGAADILKRHLEVARDDLLQYMETQQQPND